MWAIARFALWEAALFSASMRLARRARTPAEFWLFVLAIEVTLESSIAGFLSFTHLNSQMAYWLFAGVCAAVGQVPRVPVWKRPPVWAAVAAGLAVPLVLLSFKPVEEIDSINYLH